MSLHAANARLSRKWARLSPRFLPFADAATAELPMGRLLRLSLFQVTVGMAVVLLIGTLNRVMIVELGVPAWLVSAMVALPLVFAPFRAMVGYRSDTHRSVLGWRRVPYLWFGTLLQFGGFAIMPFALLVLSGDTTGPLIVGQAGAALAFLLVGAGLHTTQTVGLALATDLAPKEAHPKVVALLCAMLMAGMVVSAVVFGALLANFSEVRLIQVVQGAALVTMLTNLVALWKQEARQPAMTAPSRPRQTFGEAWAEFAPRGPRRPPPRRGGARHGRLQHAGHPARTLWRADPAPQRRPDDGADRRAGDGRLRRLRGWRRAGSAAAPIPTGSPPSAPLNGLAAFTCVALSAPLDSTPLFVVGTVLIGFGAGLFAHATLTAAMASARKGNTGLALGVWGAVQASAAGLAIAAGGILRDGGVEPRRAGRPRPLADRRLGRLRHRLPDRGRVAVRDAGRHRPARARRGRPRILFHNT